MKTNGDQFQLTKSQIEKAAQICGQVQSLLKAESVKSPEELLKANPEDQFFQDPAGALLSEDSIRTAPEPFIALAAFIAQAVEGLQAGISIVNQKCDTILNYMVSNDGQVLKAQSDTLDLIKAFKDLTPAEGFRAPSAFVTPSPLEKAAGEKPSRGYIVAKLEELVEKKQAMPTDIALFESSGRLAPHLEESIMASWASDRVNMK